MRGPGAVHGYGVTMDGGAGRIINRNPGTGVGSGSVMHPSRSVTAGGPQIEPLNSETGTSWSPYGTRVTHPYRKGMPYSMMAVEQATGFYNSAVGDFVGGGRAGQADYPNGQQTGPGMDLPRETSAHRGYMTPVGPNPNMVFFSPPVWGFQTRPIYATGRI